MNLPDLREVKELLDSGKKKEALVKANQILSRLDRKRIIDAKEGDVRTSSDSAKLYVETSQALERMGVWS